MQAWKKKKTLFGGTKFVAVFEPTEREVLGNVAATVADALMERARSVPRDELAELAGMSTGHKEPPTDPALARLLPDFEKEGEEEYEGDNSLLRSLHETHITKAKLEALSLICFAVAPETSAEVTLTEEHARLWVQALTDMRLFVHATPLEFPEHEEDRDNILEWLGYNQESLLHALMGE